MYMYMHTQDTSTYLQAHTHIHRDNYECFEEKTK